MVDYEFVNSRGATLADVLPSFVPLFSLFLSVHEKTYWEKEPWRAWLPRLLGDAL